MVLDTNTLLFTRLPRYYSAMTKNDSTKRKITDEKALELGRKMYAFYESGYISRNQALLWSFLKGLAGGFGAFLGGTIVVALLFVLLGWLSHIDALQGVVESIRSSVQQ